MEFLGFGFSGYRSIGDELVVIAPLKKINFIIGQNNSGKSNIISFLKNELAKAKSTIYLSQNPQRDNVYQSCLSDKNLIDKIDCSIAFSLSLMTINNDLSEREKTFFNLIDSSCLRKDDDLVLMKYKLSIDDKNKIKNKFYLDTACNFKPDFFSIYQRQNRYEVTGINLNSFFDFVNNKIYEIEIPPVEIIPAVRQIGVSDTELNDYSGLGIIKRLIPLQNPQLDYEKHQTDTAEQYKKSKAKFKSINNFLKIVLENDSAELEIPHTRDVILVHMDNKTLPLESLGTGIHEVIIIATAAIDLENSILCIEEPELHLHPLLQRKLIHYLSKNTSNQYIFTTHSAHLLDAAEESSIFHVKYSNGKTTAEFVENTQEKSHVCHDLGYKASDILQTNCIIWVEGPSDRIYLNFWLKSVDDKLIEGVHYSIMFFGGRLSSHLSANDVDELEDNAEDLISLRSLNRNSCILIDSDKDSDKADINNTKKRLQEEFDNGSGFAWITEGREVENYINPDDIEACIKVVHPKSKHTIKKHKWDNTLKLIDYSDKTADKVKIARYYVDNYSADLSVYDLKEKIDELIAFIKKANNID